MFRERRISRNIRPKIGISSKNSKINIMSNTIEGVYSREVSLIHLKDRETIHLDREITRPDKETMHLDRDNMLLNSIEGLKDLANK